MNLKRDQQRVQYAKVSVTPKQIPLRENKSQGRGLGKDCGQRLYQHPDGCDLVRGSEKTLPYSTGSISKAFNVACLPDSRHSIADDPSK